MSALGLLDLGTSISDVFTFLDPVSQHELRSSSSDLAARFDQAAETSALAFYADSESGLRWKHHAMLMRSSKIPKKVTANVRNFYFSTLNTYHLTNSTLATPKLTGYDEYNSDNVEVHSFILHGLQCEKLFVTGLDGIKSIDKRFCEKVTATEITFDGANQLESIGFHFMLRCPNLKKVVFKGAMPKLASIGNCFMAECPELEEIDFTGLTGLKRIELRAMFNSPKIAKIDFTPFAGTLEYIGNCFLGHVTKVENLEEKLKVLTAVKEVDTVGQYAPPALRAFAADKPVKQA